MVVTCQIVWQEISNYLENDVEPDLRAAMDVHFHDCPRCAAVLAGTRNIVQLYGDERLVALPLGFSGRLRKKIARETPAPRGTVYGWVVALAALFLIAGTFGVMKFENSSEPIALSPHAQPGKDVPPGLIVFVDEHGKLFHRAGCRYLHAQKNHVLSMPARAAEHEGYVPCIHCLGEYVGAVALDFVRKYFKFVLA